MRSGAFKRVGAAVLFSLVAGGFANNAGAEVFTYTIDPARSSLTASGTVAGATATAQTAGSNVTIYRGTVLADVTETHIDFLDGSVINADVNPAGNLQPGAFGAAGSGPADYGLRSNGPFGPAFAAYRGLVLDLFTGDPLERSGTGGIRADQFRARYDEGDVDWNAGAGFFGQAIVAGRFPFNNAPGEAILVTLEDREEFIIPLDISQNFTFLSSNDSTFRLVGTIVATRALPIPEPAGLAILALAAPLLARRRRR